MRISFQRIVSMTAGVFWLGVTAAIAGPSPALACGGAMGWAIPTSATAPISLDVAIQKVNKDFHLSVSKASMQSMCGSDSDYKVTDSNSGDLLGTVPVPNSAISDGDGRYLQVRIEQLMKTPREQLKALTQAFSDFHDDGRALDEELNVDAYVPSALPVEQRTKNNGQEYLVYVTVGEYCFPQGAVQSPYNVFQGLPIKTIEYIPGRTEYPPESIYHVGDLKKTIFSNDTIFAAIRTIVASNAEHCSSRYSSANVEWSIVEARLNGSLTYWQFSQHCSKNRCAPTNEAN